MCLNNINPFATGYEKIEHNSAMFCQSIGWHVETYLINLVQKLGCQIILCKWIDLWKRIDFLSIFKCDNVSWNLRAFFCCHKRNVDKAEDFDVKCSNCRLQLVPYFLIFKRFIKRFTIVIQGTLVSSALNIFC